MTLNFDKVKLNNGLTKVKQHVKYEAYILNSFQDINC